MAEPAPPHPPHGSHGEPATLTDADVRRIARLARVAIADSEVASVRADLAAILRHADALRSVDLTGIEPMTSPVDATARMRDDTAGPGVSTEAFLAMAPETVPPFLKVPKVLGDGSSA